MAAHLAWVETLLAHVEAARSIKSVVAEDDLQEMDKDMGSESQEFRFRAASRLLATHGDDPMLDWPLQRWLQPDDRH